MKIESVETLELSSSKRIGMVENAAIFPAKKSKGIIFIVCKGKLAISSFTLYSEITIVDRNISILFSKKY